jgi:cytidine deaminase
MSLRSLAQTARENAYAPYSNFKVGAAIETADEQKFTGVNVENVAYPEGTCAEAGAIAAMVVAGHTKIAHIYVIADSPDPVPPCGGCRQKIAEFADEATKITMATMEGVEKTVGLADLLPGAFGAAHMVDH